MLEKGHSRHRQRQSSVGSIAIRTGAGVLLGDISGFIIGIITIILVARLLGPSSYGAYTIVVSYYLLVDAAMSYGIGQYLDKHLMQYSSIGNVKAVQTAFSAGFMLSLLLGVVTMLVGIGVGFFVAGAYAKAGITFFSLVLASLVILFSVPFGSLTSALIGIGKPKLMAVASITENTVQLVASVSLVLLGYGFNGAVAGIVLGYLVGLVYASFTVFSALRSKFKIRKIVLNAQALKAAFAYSMPLGITNIMNTAVMQLSALLLGVYVAAPLVGNYGLALRSTNGIAALYSALYMTLLTSFSFMFYNKSSRGTGSKVYDRLVSYSFILSLPVLAFFAALSRPLVFLFVSHSYVYAPLYLSLISIGIALLLLGRFASSILAAVNRTKLIMFYSGISMAVQFVSLVALVPFLGVTGAIIAIFFIGGIVSSYLFISSAKRLSGFSVSYEKIFRVVAANVLLGVLLLFGNVMHSNFAALVYGVIVVLVAYPPLLGVFKALSRTELEEIKKRFGSVLSPSLVKVFDILIDYTSKFV